MIDPFRFAPWVSAEAQALFRAESVAPAAPAGDIAALREHYDAFNRAHLATALDHYPVEIAERENAGVRTHVVDPKGGGDGRILICLHGGAFMWGRGAGALLEAVPVAATSGARVIAVEYSLAPEQAFPAAVDDIVAVYRMLCAQTASTRIGMYGCSAGGALTAQAIARLIADGDPVPGAIAMLCGTGLEMSGDSAATSAALTAREEAPEAPDLPALPYFAGADLDHPQVFPGKHPAVLAQFPPSLLVSGTRDFAASSVATMHRRLLAAGADSSLILFDGMWHAHHMATTLPESRETFAAIARHFGKYLA